jgi:prepilin-type N-terminal cleavage/methylation domain-containing protein
MAPENKKSKGFTLIEVLITVAISAMLSAIVITYSGIGRNEVALSVEAAKVSQFMFQARTLAVQTYKVSASTCGYGVYFDTSNSTYSIFSYDPVAVGSSEGQTCPDVGTLTHVSSTEMSKYSDETWQVRLSSGVIFKPHPSAEGDMATLVLFYPPDPVTFISRDGGVTFVKSDSNVYLGTVGGEDTQAISINLAGQISF